MAAYLHEQGHQVLDALSPEGRQQDVLHSTMVAGVQVCHQAVAKPTAQGI
jgi:hypothetical protein